MPRFDLKLEGDLALMIAFEKSNREIRSAAWKVLKNNTELGMRQAKKYAPVDTSFLKNNIVAVTSDWPNMTTEIHSQAGYSGYQEYGTRYQSGTPFMRPALMFIYPQFRKDMLDVMRGVLK